MSFRPIDVQTLLLHIQKLAHEAVAQEKTIKLKNERQGEKLINKSKQTKEHVSTISEIEDSAIQDEREHDPVIRSSHANKHTTKEYKTIVDKTLGKRVDISR